MNAAGSDNNIIGIFSDKLSISDRVYIGFKDESQLLIFFLFSFLVNS